MFRKYIKKPDNKNKELHFGPKTLLAKVNPREKSYK